MYVITGILVVALLAVGVMYGTGVGKLSKANNHVDELTANVADLGTQLTAAQATSAGLQTQLAATQASVADLQTQLTSAKSDLSASQGKVTSLTADLSTANAKVTSLTADLATANSKVTTIQTSLDKANADKATLQSQLTSVQAKYPLKDFPDYGTFYAWVKAHVQPYTTTYGAWYSHALFVQMAAMNDGYFVSACIDYDEDVYNLALVGSTLYGWDPEDGIVYSEGTWPR
jgi:septal ring factor EnvC (AmiA/AmiB activator)